MSLALTAIGVVAVIAAAVRFAKPAEVDRRPERERDGNPEQARIDRARRLTADYRDHRFVGSLPRWDP